MYLYFTLTICTFAREQIIEISKAFVDVVLVDVDACVRRCMVCNPFHTPRYRKAYLEYGLMQCGLQEYSVQLTFREQWLDERLKFNDFGGRLKYLTLTEGNRVWMPDLFFSNEKEGHFHNIILPNVYIRIFPYGSVLYSIR